MQQIRNSDSRRQKGRGQEGSKGRIAELQEARDAERQAGKQPGILTRRQAEKQTFQKHSEAKGQKQKGRDGQT